MKTRIILRYAISENDQGSGKKKDFVGTWEMQWMRSAFSGTWALGLDSDSFSQQVLHRLPRQGNCFYVGDIQNDKIWVGSKVGYSLDALPWSLVGSCEGPWEEWRKGSTMNQEKIQDRQLSSP